ncbi:MAG: hypothetical protein C0468_06160 [Planctomyces sp.]|nr:hypothetical protein [Planctomyces sp.]MBA4120505.1 hypothetical protein [Isosphaera sp.]
MNAGQSRAGTEPRPGPIAPPARRSERAWQVAGFVLGLGLLGACVGLAVGNAQTRAQLAGLLDRPLELAAAAGLSAVAVALPGAHFWLVIRPVRRLRLADTVAVNAVCTLAGYLPFKLSLALRVWVHARRDGLPLGVIGAWLAASSVVLVAGLWPMIAASLWRGSADAWWWAGTAGGLGASLLAVVGVGRAIGGRRGWRRVVWGVDRLGVAALRRAARGRPGRRARAAAVMLSDARTVGLALGLRGVDAGVQAARFLVAAQALGRPLSVEQAVLAGATYFLIQALTPTGTLGAREGGAAGVLALSDAEQVLPLVLAVAAVDTAVTVTLGVIGAAWLRLDRAIARRRTPGGRSDGAPAR